MKIKHIDTPYWLRNRRDTVQNPNRKRKFAGLISELEEFTRTVDEQIVDHNGIPIIDSLSGEIFCRGKESQFRVLLPVLSQIVDSESGFITTRDGGDIYCKKVQKNNITN